MTVAALIVAAGKGVRAGGSVPKQFAMLCGKPMLAHSVTAMSSHPAITETIVVIGEGQEAYARANPVESVNFVSFVTGGAGGSRGSPDAPAAQLSGRITFPTASVWPLAFAPRPTT